MPLPLRRTQLARRLYSPDTNAIDAALNDTCMDCSLKNVKPKAGAHRDSTSYVPTIAPQANGKAPRVEAIDVATGRTIWKHEQRAVWYRSLLGTGGAPRFGGDVDRWFNAFDARTGEKSSGVRA